MSGRELVILLLGLAIVAVVLRGLYVALNGRRGQIKLAIDKNIPRDVDLEALELAELPGGGARVVHRSLQEVNRQNSRLNIAESKAKALDLADAADTQHIPVLMDAVELSPVPTPVAPVAPVGQDAIDQAAVEFGQAFLDQQEPDQQEPDQEEPDLKVPDQEELDRAALEQAEADEAEEWEQELEQEMQDEFSPVAEQEHKFGADWEQNDDDDEADLEADDSDRLSGRDEDDEEDEDPDSVLLDYGDDDADEEYEDAEENDLRSHVDTMSSVAPDYEDEAEPQASEELTDAIDEAADFEPEDFRHADEDVNDLEVNDLDDDAEVTESAFAADDDMDQFPMTAGERIGSKPPAIGETKQSSLFDAFDEEEADAAAEPKSKTKTKTKTEAKKNRSLFSLFGRKTSNRSQQAVDDELDHDAARAAANASKRPSAYQASSRQDSSVEVEAAPVFDKHAVTAELTTKQSPPAASATKPAAEGFEHAEVLVLNVTARNGRVFSGDDILHILITSGLKFGDMNIFHKRLSKENQGAVIFSVANMLNPGTFDLNRMDEFTTLGISFFLALPSPINNLDAFEQMLAVAQNIRNTLDGDLKDDRRNGMTAQTIEHYRQRIRDFELRRLKAVAARR